jgi:hypothetical protein
MTGRFDAAIEVRLVTPSAEPLGAQAAVAVLQFEGVLMVLLDVLRGAGVFAVGGREMTAQTRWDGGKLVTLVRDPRGMQFTEVRSLSEDGRVQTIEGFVDPSRKQAMFKRVMIKQ